MGTEVARINDERGAVVRDGFGTQEVQRTAETAALSIAARERAVIEARYLMAERHPRNWDTVRVRLLAHCERPGFAEVARYKKPAGKQKINGEWKETYAEGLSARFAETARQEMGNTNTETSITYEDALVRIIRATVVDLERNSIESREVTIAKVVEKRGNQRGSEWDPPKGREVISSRFNSYGEPVFLVKATDDEIRIKQNSEISKTTRDASLRLIPKDIRDDSEAKIRATLADPKKTDPNASRKRIIDSFAGDLSVLPDDLMTYIGAPLDRLSPAQLDELRGLYTAIRDGEITMAQAIKAKYDTSDRAEEDTDAGGGETRKQHDARLQKQMQEQAEAARQKQESEKSEPVRTQDADRSLTPEENRALDAKLAAEEQGQQAEQPARPKPVFGRGKNA